MLGGRRLVLDGAGRGPLAARGAPGCRAGPAPELSADRTARSWWPTRASSPATDNQVNLGALQAELACLLKGGLVVPGQPGQAGDRQVVVTLVDGEGHRPLNQSLDPRGDGRLLRDSTCHIETLAHPPDGPAPPLHSLLAGAGTPASGAPPWPPPQSPCQPAKASGPLPLLALSEPTQPAWLGVTVKQPPPVRLPGTLGLVRVGVVVGHGILPPPQKARRPPLGGLMHRAGTPFRHPAARWVGRRQHPDRRPTSLPQSRQCPS
jgi:hypothetical protein